MQFVDGSNEKQVGIVLFYTDFSVAILQKNNIRIDGILYGNRPIRGSCISFLSSYQKNRTIIEHIAIEYVPTLYESSDIYFLHAMLELCYYFIPEHGNETLLYQIIVELYNIHGTCDRHLQKIFLCKMLAHMGIYPMHDYNIIEQNQHFFSMFLKMPIDIIIMRKLDLGHEVFFNNWLIWCLENYPQGKKCKALPLFLQSDLL